MSYATGMLAVQTLSSCFTTSTVHYDGGGGGSKNFYCEYQGTRINPGEPYELSSSETCTCDENGLKCCRSEKSHKSHRSRSSDLDAPFGSSHDLPGGEFSADLPSFGGSRRPSSISSESFDLPRRSKKARKSRRKNRFQDEFMAEDMNGDMFGANANLETFPESMDFPGAGPKKKRKSKRKKQRNWEGSMMDGMSGLRENFGSFHEPWDFPSMRFGGSRKGRRKFKRVMKSAFHLYHDLASTGWDSFGKSPLRGISIHRTIYYK